MALAKYRDPGTGEWKYVDIPPHHHDSRYVNTDGDTMTGPLILSQDATDPMGAATLRQVADVDKSYTHTQEVPSDVWTIAHGLGKQPAVDVLDGGSAVVYGEIVHVDQDNLTIRFQWPITGTAICN